MTYVAVAILSLQMATVHVSASPVWPPSGLAIGALTLLGLRYWPVIVLGAFAANAVTTGHVASSITIALGNTLEAVLGAWVLQRAAAGSQVGTLRTVMALALVAPAAAAVSAVVGVASLIGFGLLPLVAAREVAVTWWLGNIGGTLLVAPLILAWRRPAWQDVVALVASAVIVALAFATSTLWLVFLILIMFWAVRLQRESAVLGVAVGAAIGGIGLTVQGRGPFFAGAPNEALLLVQLFIIFIALAAMVLAAEQDRRQTRSVPAVALAAVAITLAPLMAGAIFVGDTLQPTLQELQSQRQGEVLQSIDDAWSGLLDDQSDQLRSLAAFMLTGDVNASEFAQFVAATGWRFGPGQSTAIGFVQIVDHADLLAYEAMVRADEGYPQVVRDTFQVFPASNASEHATVRLVYPLDPQPGAIGFDLFADPAQAEVLRGSVGLDGPLASPPVEIVRPAGNGTGIILTLPVSDGTLKGFVTSVLALPDADSAPVTPTGIDYRIVDVTAGDAALFATGNSTWSASFTREVWGRDWRFDVAMPTLATATERAAPWFIVAGTGIMGASMGLVVYAYDTSRDRANRLGEQMAAQARKDEQRRAKIKQLEELDAFRQRFLNMASHELRTPLVPLLTQAHILQALNLGEQAERSLAVIDRSSRRLSLIIDDLLLAAKAESNQLKMAPRELDLARLAQDAIAAHADAAAAADVTVELEARPTLALIDEARIAQVLDNLLANAIRFAPGGHVHVEVRDEDGPTIRVRDDGEGVDAATLRLLGQPFMQGDHDKGGTGLGLYICKTLVRLHGGELTMHSDGLGKGMTVTIRLPGSA